MTINWAFGKDMMLTTHSSVVRCTEYLSKHKNPTSAVSLTQAQGRKDRDNPF